MSKVTKKLSWKAWLAIAIVGASAFTLLFVFFGPTSPVARQLGMAPEPEPYLVESTGHYQGWVDLLSPANSAEDYVNILYSSTAGYMYKKLALSETALADMIGLDSMYTNTGQARIAYMLQETSAGHAWISVIFKDTDGTWRSMLMGNRAIPLLFDSILPSIVTRLGYAPLPPAA